jgi:hypothetical protein
MARFVQFAVPYSTGYVVQNAEKTFQCFSGPCCKHHLVGIPARLRIMSRHWSDFGMPGNWWPLMDKHETYLTVRLKIESVFEHYAKQSEYYKRANLVQRFAMEDAFYRLSMKLLTKIIGRSKYDYRLRMPRQSDGIVAPSCHESCSLRIALSASSADLLPWIVGDVKRSVPRLREVRRVETAITSPFSIRIQQLRTVWNVFYYVRSFTDGVTIPTSKQNNPTRAIISFPFSRQITHRGPQCHR